MKIEGGLPFMRHAAICLVMILCIIFSPTPAPAADGVLDPIFHPNDGFLLWDGGNGWDRGRAIALQADEKLLVTGYQSNSVDNDVPVVRFTADGGIDTNFGNNGVFVFDGQHGSDIGYAVAVDGRGRIWVAGVSNNGSDDDLFVLRLTGDGTLDDDFADGGIFRYDKDGGNEGAVDLVLQPDGKALVTGQRHNGHDYDLLLLRLTADGMLDDGFAGGGVAVYDHGNGNDGGLRLALQADLKIVVAGHAEGNANYDLLIARFNSDGTLDDDFGTGGVGIYDGGDDDRGYGLGIQADSKLLVTGASANDGDEDIPLIRFNDDGSLDTAFGQDGVVIFDNGGKDEGYDLHVQADGRIVVAGFSASANDWDLVVLKYTSDGTPDATFGDNGVYRYDGGGADWGYGVAFQVDNKLLVVGQSHNGSDDDIAIIRLTNSVVQAPVNLESGGGGCWITSLAGQW